MFRRRAGQTAPEQLLVIALVACAGMISLPVWGTAMSSALSGAANGTGPERSFASLAVVAPSAGVPSAGVPSAGVPSAGVPSTGAVPPSTSAQAGAASTAFYFIDAAIDLADDVRRVRKPSWENVRYASGDLTNPLQLALELEGDAPDIVALYRPANMTDTAWELLDLDEQWEKLEELGWDDLVLMKKVPYPFQPKLADDYGRWEARTKGYVDTLDELFAQASYLDEEVGEGGFHWHVSFRGKAHDPFLLAYWQHAEEYSRLRMIGHSGVNIRSPHLRALEPSVVEGVRLKYLRESKLHTVGLRSRIYGERGRIGLEIRAANFDLEEAARMVDSTVRVLEDRKRGTIAFNRRVKRYGMDSVLSVDREAELHRIPDDLARRAGRGFRGDRQIFFEMPFVHWESRPWLAEKAPLLDAARRKYVRTLQKSVRDTGHLTLDAVGDALEVWAKETGLADLY